ncbi:hypothetical protein GGR22_000702 [Flavobacterium gossypii]|uniref:Restriction endonuclease type IV Mrr domain-containing protein n=1 Tax=Flavobacterium gossypii TaxID=1646119 RepID=A0ABR6DMN4_9FLAO|nr:hypothetical protein [Flavobacterium gossypii]MBA9072576.1 hypothetical protein [Flavobacterium gossypii]
MSKKGGEFEVIAIDFFENIFKELNFKVVRKRIQNSGSQDGYDILIEIVDERFRSYYIFIECKDYNVELNYSDAIIKLPQIASTHEDIDLVVFISPRRNFSNIFEETRNKPFLESLSNSNFRVTFLSPETDVQKYFSLYPEIYNKIYAENAPTLTIEDRKEILDQFNKFIFSSKNLNKVIIDETDKEKFIKNLEKDNFHIERTIRTSQKRESYFYNPDSGKSTLNTIIKNQILGVVLLGNPGYGKTNELKHFAVDLWDNRNENDLIPFFYKLKNFTSSSKIEDFLPSNYKFIYDFTIILDGIDEIENIIDFTNKLRNFISENRKNIDDKRTKFVISCRTNVYKKYIKIIDDFEICYLNEISLQSSNKFLNEKYNLDFLNEKKFDFHKHREILESPFYLELIGSHFEKTGILLTNKAQLINAFVDSRLFEDEEVKFQNDTIFDKDKLISYTQKIAFALEAMQKTSLPSSQIKIISNINERDFAKNPFIEENLSDNWSFAFKNIQEYFVAKMLENLSFEEIISFIKIDDKTNKIHPTWHNVITFLLNLQIDSEIHKSLVDWLLVNDFELLFSADSDRINNDVKINVLETFFSRNCIENTLWINNTQEVANFSECEANIKYLIEKIKDKTIHRRARMSAIKLLSHMDMSQHFLDELKLIIPDILEEDNFEDENNLYLKQDIIMLTDSVGVNEDVEFFNKIILLLRHRDNKEIISSIIHSVPNKSIEDNIDYFLEILDKSIGNKNWIAVSKYNSITSTKDKLFDLFLRVNNPDILLKIYSFLVERHKNYQIRENLIKDFLNYFKEFFEAKLEHHDSLIEIISNAVINDKIRYFEDDLLVDIVKACKIEKKVFTKIIQTISGNSDRKHFLAEIIIKDYFNEVLNLYLNKKLNDDFLHQFRNVISHRDLNLSRQFEEYIESNSKYIFRDKISTDEIEERKKYWESKNQKNFDVLFKNEEIVFQITKLYDFLGKEELSYDDLDKFYHKYYENFELQKEVTENAKHLLYEILRDNYKHSDKLNRKELPLLIENYKFNIMLDIMNCLPEKGKKIEISDKQKKHINDWCNENTETAKEYYLKHLSIGNNRDDEKYNLFQAIFKFQKHFKFNLDETLLLDMIWFNTYEKGIEIDYMQGVVSEEKINNRILKNLKDDRLSPTSYCNHLKYCIENKINYKQLNLDIKEKINIFLNSDYYFYSGQLLEMFFSNDLKTLKEFLNCDITISPERKKHFFDNTISILLKNNHAETAKVFLIVNYEQLISQNVYQEIEIIGKLIDLNYERTFDNYYNLIKTSIENSIKLGTELRNNDWQKYTNKFAIDKLIKLLELCLSTSNIDSFFDRFSDPIRIASETILNICKTNDSETCVDVIEKLNDFDLNKIKSVDGELFHYNKLKNDVQEIYYSHKSKPFTIVQVLKVFEEKKYIFLN